MIVRLKKRRHVFSKRKKMQLDVRKKQLKKRLRSKSAENMRKKSVKLSISCS